MKYFFNALIIHAKMVEFARTLTLHIRALVQITQWETTAKQWFVVRTVLYKMYLDIVQIFTVFFDL